MEKRGEVDGGELYVTTIHILKYESRSFTRKFTLNSYSIKLVWSLINNIQKYFF